MKAREVIRLLKKDGWYVKVQKGSHRQFVHPRKIGKVTVPMHSGIYQRAHSKAFLNRLACFSSFKAEK